MTWRAYGQDNKFGEDCLIKTTTAYVKKDYDDFKFAKLYKTDDGYLLSVTSRCYYIGVTA